jgi:predicted aldo/keto reductase-like oxidoreductase
MKRRDFLNATLLAGMAKSAARRAAHDIVTLGPDQVRLSRLAVGTGTKGYRKSSNQTRQLGLQGVADLLKFGYDHGVTFWDSADGYGSHPHLKLALKALPREKVVIMTKTRARTAQEMRADLERFRQEIGTDYLDIVLLHAVTAADWPAQRQGAMDALSEARERKIVRTHGVSCHSLDALRTAAATPWVHVDLARINPAGVLMDADTPTVVSVLKQMKADGKGIIGMKLLGEGQLRERVDAMLRYALNLECIDCFTIGAESRDELADLIKRISAA